MRAIYTFGGKPAQRNLTLPDMRAATAEGRKLVQANAMEAAEAEAVEQAGIDILSVTSTKFEEARTAAPHIYTIATIGAAHIVSEEEVLREAFRVATAGADAIYTIRSLKVVEMLAREGLSVQGHAGLVPRKSIATGGLRAMGRTAAEAMAILDDVRRLEDAGAVAVELECVAAEAARLISRATPLVTHSIGSGWGGDVIFLFTADVCGDTPNPPRHARAFGNLLRLRKEIEAERLSALSAFAGAVRDGAFPSPAEVVGMARGEQERLMEALDRRQPFHQ